MKITCTHCNHVSNAVNEAQLGMQNWTLNLETKEYERREFENMENDRATYSCINCGEELTEEQQQVISDLI